MKRGTILVALMLLTAMNVMAKRTKFHSNEEALGYIRQTCEKYWQHADIRDLQSRKIMVEQQGSNLIFKEVTTFKRPAMMDKEAYEETKNVITTVDMNNVNIPTTYTNVELLSKRDKAIVSNTVWSTDEKGRSTENLPLFVLPLKYDSAGVAGEVGKMKDAFRYVIGQYNKEVNVKRQTVFTR